MPQKSITGSRAIEPSLLRVVSVILGKRSARNTSDIMFKNVTKENFLNHAHRIPVGMTRYPDAIGRANPSNLVDKSGFTGRKLPSCANVAASTGEQEVIEFWRSACYL